MALKLHDRRASVRTIPDGFDRLLRKHFSGQPLPSHKAGNLKLYLNELRDQRYWLACDCRTNTKPPPLLSIRRTDTAVTIVRHGATPHDDQCPFFREAPAITGEPASSEERTAPFLPIAGPLLTLKATAGKLTSSSRADKESASPKRKQPPKIPELAGVLMTLLQQAKLNTLTANEALARRDKPVIARDAKTQYQKLYSGLEQPVTSGFDLARVSCAHITHVPRFLASFRRRCEPLFPDGIRPQGLAVFLVDDWEPAGKNKARLLLRQGSEFKSCTVHGSVRRYGHYTTPGPLWFIGHVGQKPTTGLYEILHGYLHPAFSKTILMPVDSGLERSVAESLIRLMSYWAWKLNLKATLVKPLFDMRNDGGDWVRPDFELQLASGKRIVIEVMGSDDDDYLERKAEMMRGLSGQSDVIEVFTWDADTDPFDIGPVMTAAALKSV